MFLLQGLILLFISLLLLILLMFLVLLLLELLALLVLLIGQFLLLLLVFLIHLRVARVRRRRTLICGHILRMDHGIVRTVIRRALRADVVGLVV